MTKSNPSRAWRSCPWFQPSTTAAFAAEAVSRLIVPEDVAMPFASPRLQSMFRARTGMTINAPNASDSDDDTARDSRLLAALLHKFAVRGEPAPCSIDLERYALGKAQAAGVLDWQEIESDAEFRFQAEPRIPNLDAYLKLCLVPELCISSEEETQDLVEAYEDLCTPPEASFLRGLAAEFEDPRLALLFRPQRPIGTMVRSTENTTVNESDRVDFAIDLPSLDASSGRAFRGVVELDDAATHSSHHARSRDRARDELLEDHRWHVYRFPESADSIWAANREDLAETFESTLGRETIEALADFESLSREARKAIVDLIVLPVAEAQLLYAVARYLHAFPHASAITIANPQSIDIEPVVDAINQTMSTCAELHGIDRYARVQIGDIRSASIVYYGLPSAGAWQSNLATQKRWGVGPTIAPLYSTDALLPASPRPIIASESSTREGQFRSLVYLLQQGFRKKKFRPGQLPIIQRAIALQDVVGLLPTGAGKSICYQLAALCQPGMTLVVDPLVSLIVDQREGLKQHGIHRTIDIRSGLHAQDAVNRDLREARYRALAHGWPIFTLIAPERLQMPEFREQVQQVVGTIPIVFCVVDEAHCVSEWGHDFRPSYLNIGRLMDDYCTVPGAAPPVLLGLTGTASENVLKDIMRELQITDTAAVVKPTTFNRKELHFLIKQVKGNERDRVLQNTLQEVINEFAIVDAGGSTVNGSDLPSGLVFCYFVNGKLGADSIRSNLASGLGLDIGIYSGSKPRSASGTSSEWDQTKQRVQLDFKRGKQPILVCTHAFGMGIDKPDVRFTIHSMLPRSLEEFYQQAGRAGRDEKDALCVIIFSDDQPEIADLVLEPDRTQNEEIEDQIADVRVWDRSDALRSLWFHGNAYRGRDLDHRIMVHVIDQIIIRNLPDSGQIRDEIIGFDWLPGNLLKVANQSPSMDDRQTALEKALYRLQEVGAIRSYMKDYSARNFIVTLHHPTNAELLEHLQSYRSRYDSAIVERVSARRISHSFLRDTMVECSRQLIEVLYSTVEAQRRRAMLNMLRAARVAAVEGESKFRAELLAYFGGITIQ